MNEPSEGIKTSGSFYDVLETKLETLLPSQSVFYDSHISHTVKKRRNFPPLSHPILRFKFSILFAHQSDFEESNSMDSACSKKTPKFSNWDFQNIFYGHFFSRLAYVPVLKMKFLWSLDSENLILLPTIHAGFFGILAFRIVPKTRRNVSKPFPRNVLVVQTGSTFFSFIRYVRCSCHHRVVRISVFP